jgi:tetratricopeptide (TPR) repeat protein
VFFVSATIVSVLLFPRALGAQYVGHQVCAGCHPRQSADQLQTGHARALVPAKDGIGKWAFGAGSRAITFVSQVDRDTYLEHGLSYYTERKAMGITPGHSNSDGRRYRTFEPAATTLRCFRCHSTGPLRLGAARQIEVAEPGVHCESCHGPGQDHVKQAGAADTIFSPKRLTASELNEFCGTCHRKAGDISDWSNSWNVRHQPAYLSQAACFRKSAALTCLSCHNPHTPLNRVSQQYDARCSGCHAVVHHRSAVASRACVECHMPQVPTNAGLKFTNHWIGIYRKENPLVPLRRPGQTLPPVTLASLRGKITPPADPSSFQTLYEQVIAEQQNQLGTRHKDVARAATDLGLFLQSTGKPEEAVPALEKALEIDTANEDPAIAGDEENLASVFAALDRPNDEFRLLQLAAHGKDRAVAARTLARMAALDPVNAETYDRQALTNEEAASGKEHPRVAVLLNNLALAQRQKNDNRAAEPLLRRAAAIQQKAFGGNSPAVASTLNNLGSLLQSTGKMGEAEQVERAALRIFEQKLGPETGELATTCTNLADLLWTKGAKAEATQLYRRALEIDESIYGADHPEVAGDLGNLGLLLRELGQSAAAEPLLRRALAIYDKHLGPASPQAVQMREYLKPAVTR